MSEPDVVFDEDKSMLHALPPETAVPDTGFEGWFYKKVPGSYLFKKLLLIGIIIAIFAAAIALFALGRYNFKMEELKSFDERANATRL